MIVKIGRLAHKLLEGVDIPAVVAGLIDGGFSDEGDVSEAWIVEQNTEWFDADGTFSNVLMAVELRSSGSLGVVAMDDFHMVQANRPIEMLQGLVDALLADDVIAGDVRVAGINACGNGNNGTEAGDDFGRVLLNSTFGIVGIFDLASMAGARARAAGQGSLGRAGRVQPRAPR